MIDIDKIKAKFKHMDFYRIFIVEKKVNNISANNGKIENIEDKILNGMSVFFVKNKKSYFYATNELKKINEFNPDVVKNMPKNIDYEPRESMIKDNITIGKKTNLDLETITKKFIKATKPKPKSVSRKGKYIFIEDTRQIISENTDITKKTYYNFAMLFNTVKENNVIREDYVRFGIPTGLNDIDPFLEKYDKNYNETIKKLKYKESKLNGKYNIVLTPDLVDLLAHEAIGHATEADLVYNDYSVLKNKLNTKIGPDFITLYDDPTDNALFGTIKYDDEGFKAKKKTLIKNGILNDYILNDRFSQLMGLENNGGARSQNYDFLPIPRMTNTHLKEGNTPLEEILNSEKEIIFLKGFRGGQTNPTNGIFQFGIKDGEIIKKGKTTERFVNTQLSGNILDILFKIKAVSKEKGEQSPGFCGKSNQTAFVSGKDPYILLKEVFLK